MTKKFFSLCEVFVWDGLYVATVENCKKRLAKRSGDLKTINQIIVDEFINYQKLLKSQSSYIGCHVKYGRFICDFGIDPCDKPQSISRGAWLCGDIYLKNHICCFSRKILDKFCAFISVEFNNKSDVNHVFFGSNVWPHKYPINKYYLSPSAFKSFHKNCFLARHDMSIENKVFFRTRGVASNTSKLEIYAFNNNSKLNSKLIGAIHINKTLGKRHIMIPKSIKNELIEESMITQQTIELLLLGGQRRFGMIVLVRVTLIIDSNMQFKCDASKCKVMYGKIGMQLNSLDQNHIGSTKSTNFWADGRSQGGWSYLNVIQHQVKRTLTASLVCSNYLAFLANGNRNCPLLLIIFSLISQDWYIDPKIFQKCGIRNLDNIHTDLYCFQKPQVNSTLAKSFAVVAADQENSHKQQIPIIWPVMWEVERIMWIGFYKNESNKNCKLRNLPKDIVIEILTWCNFCIFNGDQYSKPSYTRTNIRVENRLSTEIAYAAYIIVESLPFSLKPLQRKMFVMFLQSSIMTMILFMTIVVLVPKTLIDSHTSGVDMNVCDF